MMIMTMSVMMAVNIILDNNVLRLRCEDIKNYSCDKLKFKSSL